MNLALPTITRYFGVEIITVQWVVAAYLLTVTGLLLTFGRLADLLGRQRLFALGIAVFTLGSGLCSVSSGVFQLIGFRVVQGLGAAMLMATGPAIITHAFPGRERGKALGIIGTVVSIGSTTGPMLGGLLIGWLGWQSIFYINLPVGLLGFYLASKKLHREPATGIQGFDFAGAITVFVSLVSFLLALGQGENMGWGSLFIVGLFLLACVFFVLFVFVELRVEDPVMDFSLFRNSSFTASNASGFLTFTSMFIFLFLLPYYLEDSLGYPPERVGMVLVAFPLVMAVVSPLSGWISDRTGSFILSSLGLGVAAFALFLVSRFNEASRFHEIVGVLALMGLGIGLFQSPNNSIIMGSVPPERLGIAAGTMATTRNLGMVTGIALAAAFITSRQVYYHAFIPAFQDTLKLAALICSLGVLTSLVRGKHGRIEQNR